GVVLLARLNRKKGGDRGDRDGAVIDAGEVGSHQRVPSGCPPVRPGAPDCWVVGVLGCCCSCCCCCEAPLDEAPPSCSGRSLRSCMRSLATARLRAATARFAAACSTSSRDWARSVCVEMPSLYRSSSISSARRACSAVPALASQAACACSS